MVSALENGVKGGRWYSLMDKVYAPATLEAAWDEVRANGGAAGVDGQSIERFEAQADMYLAELSTALREGSYRPQPVRRVEIPKGDGRTRPLGIPAVKDRIVQTAVKLVIEPIFEATFRPTSYGFRPGRGCQDALREVDQLIEEGYTFVVDADFESYFDTIPHERLMQRVEERISDGRMLALLRSWLDQDILQGMERWTPTAGTPQGAVISPLLANIYLHPLDELMAAAAIGWCAMRTTSWCCARAAKRPRPPWRRSAPGWRRTACVCIRTKRMSATAGRTGQGFEFLGYRFEAGRRLCPQEEPGPPQGQHPGKDATNARGEPRAHHRRSQPDAARLVRLLQACASHTPSSCSTGSSADGCARSCASRTSGPASDAARHDHQRWPNAFFAQAGLLALHAAWQTARHSR